MEIAYGVRNKRELQQHQKLLDTLSIAILDVDETISTTARHWVREYGYRTPCTLPMHSLPLQPNATT